MITNEVQLTKTWQAIMSNETEVQFTISNLYGGRVSYYISNTNTIPTISCSHIIDKGTTIDGRLKSGQYVFCKALDDIPTSIIFSKIGNVQLTQGYIEQNIKLGTQYEISTSFTAVAAGAVCGLKFTTGAKSILLKGSNISTDAQSIISRISSGVTATDGATIPTYNLNDMLNPKPSLVVAKVVTAISGGTDVFAPIYQKISSGGTGGASTVRGGGAVVPGLEKVLKPNTTYFFTFQNGGAAVADITFYGTFYEGEYVV